MAKAAAAPPPAAPAAKKSETKQLTEVQKLKLFNVHLSQKVAQLEKDKVTQMNTIVSLQSELQTHKSNQTDREAEAVYKELGIVKGDELELRNDGTLTINPPPAGSKPTQELFAKKNKRANGERRGPQAMPQN